MRSLREYILSASLAVIVILSANAVFAAEKGTSRGEQSSERKKDEEAVRKTSEAFREAFEKGDAKALGALWTEGAEYHDDSGMELHGRAAIEKAYSALFQKKAHQKIEVNIDSIRFPARDLAIEEGTVRVAASGQELPTSSRYSVLHVKEDGKWKMALSSEWGASEHSLDELSWLIGDWGAKTEDREVSMSFAWNDKKTLIENRFTMKEGGKVTSSGTQTIAFDRQTGEIRSWNFDQEGGHGQSFWSRDENRWVLESTSVLPDGSEGSATNLISRLGDDAFLWRSVNRRVNGVEVPETTPLKVVRMKSGK